MAKDPSHQTHYLGHPYVRVTFREAGGKRRQCWAVKLGVSPSGVVKYLRAGDGGGYWQDPAAPGAVCQELILALQNDVLEEPAGVNLRYARMEVLK